MVRVTVELNERMIKKCLKATGLKNEQALLRYALRMVDRMERQKKILELKGKIVWEGDLDEMRTGRIFEI